MPVYPSLAEIAAVTHTMEVCADNSKGMPVADAVKLFFTQLLADGYAVIPAIACPDCDGIGDCLQCNQTGVLVL
jgi:hypothetical protein